MFEAQTYIVIDESGAGHQIDNDYFIIGGYITWEINKVRSLHKKIEKKTKEDHPTLKNRELKASILTANNKSRFLNALLEIPSVIPAAIIVDKRALVKRKQSENVRYNYYLKTLLTYLLNNYTNFLLSPTINMYLDSRNVKMKSLKDLEHYLNEGIGIKFNKKFRVEYRSSCEHREIQMADYIVNALFGHYNYRGTSLTYKMVPKLKRIILSKFPYSEFKEPKKTPIPKIDSPIKM